jgi:ribose-phosphate pyrophosphokinase
MKRLKVFALNGTKKYAETICDYLDCPLSTSTEKYFSDKEIYIKSDVNVRGSDVYVISSLYSDENETVNDKFLKLLFFIGALKDASAERVTAVIPYMGYQRQDRKVESRAPITTKYVAQMLESVGVNRVLSIDVHNLSAFQNSIRIPTDHLEAKNLITSYLAEQLKETDKEIAVLAPDSGGASRADRYCKALSTKLKRKVDLVYMAKIREGNVLHASRISDDVKGKLLIAVDDMISSGGTLAKCSETTEAGGAILWAVCATHPVFVDNINENLAKLKKVIVTDTIPISKILEELKPKIKILSTTKLFAQAISRIHDHDGSISDLLK